MSLNDSQRQQLANLIDSTEDLRLLIAAPKNLLAALNFADQQQENHTLQTAKVLPITFGMDAATQIVGAFKAVAALNPLFDSMYIALSTVGLDFAHPITQGAIDSLVAGGAFTAEQGASVKALGIWQASLASLTFGEEVTQEDVDTAIVLHNRLLLQKQVSNRYNDVVSQVIDGTLTTWEEARASLGGV